MVNSLKTSFNTVGDAELDSDVDIMAVAGLLKMFLRELPDSLIPENLTQDFIDSQMGMQFDKTHLFNLCLRFCLTVPPHGDNFQSNKCSLVCLW